MPTFPTPEPIALTLELGAGEVRLRATDRTDTVVEVRPGDDADESDVQAAAQVRVDYHHGTLQIIGPKAPRLDFSRKTRAVEVTVDLPTGSQVTAQLQAGDLLGEGQLGRCQLKTSAGNVRVDRTGPLRLETSAGHIEANAVAGDAVISTGSGAIRLGAIEGTAEVKNSNGNTAIDSVTGEAKVRASNGDINVGHVESDVDAKSSNGHIRLGEVVRGSVVLATAMGDLDVGVAAGTAAWLEVTTGFGHVRNQLDSAERPDATDETVEVRGRTAYGDVIIRRP